MFSELREKRLSRQKAVDAERERSEQAKREEAEKIKQQAAAEVIRSRQESVVVLERFFRLRPMVEKVVRQYCEAIFGDSEKFLFGYEAWIVDSQTNQMYSTHDLETQNILPVYRLVESDQHKLLAFLKNKNNWRVDSLLTERSSFFDLRAKHGRLYEVLVKSVSYTIPRATDTNYDETDGQYRVTQQYLCVSIDARTISISFSSEHFPEVILTAQTEQELVAKITELERQIQEKLEIN